jgi:hypothetical protein
MQSQAEYEAAAERYWGNVYDESAEGPNSCIECGDPCEDELCAYHLALKPTYCAGCGETEVVQEGDVCQECRASGPEDWCKGFYEVMREAVVKADARKGTTGGTK